MNLTPNKPKNTINMLEKGRKESPGNEVHQIERCTKKVKVAGAMDTSATTNATPNGVFGTAIKKAANEARESLYGADNTEISISVVKLVQARRLKTTLGT